MRTTQSWIAVVCVGAAAGLALVGAGTAGATEDEFIYALNNSGIVGPRPELVELGLKACGTDRGEAVSAINSQSGLDDARSGFIYDSAVNYLC